MRRENHWLDTSYLFEEDTKGRKKKKGNPPLEKDEEEDFVLFEEEDLKENRQSSERSAAEEEKYEKEFIDFFMEEAGIEEEEERYLSPMQRASIERSNNIYERYKAGEEWLMSEGGDDLAKGFVNNFRSSVGGLVEDAAYLINDYAPWYKPAKKVVENNTAGKIKETAEKQFANAKEKVGETGNRAIDMADSFSESLGYSIFGLKASSYLEAAGESLREYRKLRESGYSEEEAAGAAAEKAIVAVLMEKAEDYIGKNNPVNEVLYGSNGNKIDQNDIYENWYKEHKEDFGDDIPETFAEYEKWLYNKTGSKETIDVIKKRIDTVENAPCELTQKKITHYMLEPGKKHSKDFFDVGYTERDSLLLKSEIAEQFDIRRAVDFGPGYKEPQVTFSIFMELGVTEKKRFRTVWQIDSPGETPRIITNHRED